MGMDGGSWRGIIAPTGVKKEDLTIRQFVDLEMSLTNDSIFPRCFRMLFLYYVSYLAM